MAHGASLAVAKKASSGVRARVMIAPVLYTRQARGAALLVTVARGARLWMSLGVAAMVLLLAPLTARAATYTAGTSIDVPSFDSPDGAGAADPYATNTITVSGFHGKVSHLSLSLLGFSHENADDVDMLLVGPTGKAVT